MRPSPPLQTSHHPLSWLQLLHQTPVSYRAATDFRNYSCNELWQTEMFSPKIAVGTNGSVIHRKQVNAEKVKRERTVNDWWKAPPPSLPVEATESIGLQHIKHSTSSSSILGSKVSPGWLWVLGVMKRCNSGKICYLGNRSWAPMCSGCWFSWWRTMVKTQL